MTNSALCLSSLIFRMKTKISTNLTKSLEEFKDTGSEHNAWHLLDRVQGWDLALNPVRTQGKSKAYYNTLSPSLLETKLDYCEVITEARSEATDAGFAWSEGLRALLCAIRPPPSAASLLDGLPEHGRSPHMFKRMSPKGQPQGQALLRFKNWRDGVGLILHGPRVTLELTKGQKL